MEMQLQPIGLIKTPYHSLNECPHNINIESGPLCKLSLNKIYKDGIKGLKINQKIAVMYWLTPSTKVNITCTDCKGLIGGLFSTRSPHRPNPIGLAIVKIENINDNCLFVRGLDCLNDTKLIDIKPAIKEELTEY